MLLLVQFLYRLSFGMAAAMAVTSPGRVTSGYFRNNCYVLLGLNLLAALASQAAAVDVGRPAAWPAVAGAIVSYVAAVCWLYEKSRPGILSLVAVGACSVVGAMLATSVAGKPPQAATLAYVDAVSSGLLLGTTMAAMLLGHWYLNAPGMQIAPLQKLNLLLGAAVVLRAVVSGVGLAASFGSTDWQYAQEIMLAMRWLAGMLGTLVLVAMTHSTLKIPNTQAATGMLYVAVITTFLGELVGQLLSAASVYPL